MELNTIKPAAGAKQAQPSRRPRHRLGPRQDRRPRPQGPEVALGRLPQGRLRRRPDAAAAPPAQARLQVADAQVQRPKCACRDLERLAVDEIDLLALKQAGVRRPSSRKSCKVIKSGETRAQGGQAARASARPRARRRRSRRPAARSPERGSCLNGRNQWQPTRINWPRAASSATCGAGCCSCWARWSSTASARTFRCPGIDPDAAGAAVQGQTGRHPGHVQHVLGRRAVALHRVRARDHAVHLGVDHHAADDRTSCRTLEALKKEGEAGPPQDHAVHALRHAGPGAVPGARHRARAGRLAAGLVLDPGFGFRLTAVVTPGRPARCS